MNSLRTKLVLAFLAVSALGIALGMAFAGLTMSGEFRRFVFSLNEEDLQGRLASYYVEQGSWAGLENGVWPALPPPQGAPPSMRPGVLTLTDGAGRVIVAGGSFQADQVLAPNQLTAFDPIRVNGVTVGYLVVEGEAFVPRGGESDFLLRLNNTLLLGALAAFAVAVVAGVLAARSLTRPLRQMTAATRAVAAGDFERKVEIHSGDELGALAESFNRMSAALGESQRLRRQMTADIAHELRTPLSIILGHLDAVEDGVLTGSAETTRVIREETERLSRLIEDLRLLTRADAGELVLAKRQGDVGDLAASVVMAYHPQAASKDIDLVADLEPGLEPIDLDPDRMHQVLGNLLTNALYHTPRGGRMTVGTRAAAGGVEIFVRDSGPGIAVEDLARVFDRFYRSDRARRREDGGSGLGLAIARSIVEAHGGRIRAERPEGGGGLITVELPRIRSE